MYHQLDFAPKQIKTNKAQHSTICYRGSNEEGHALSDADEDEVAANNVEVVPASPVAMPARSCFGNISGMRDNELFASPFHAPSPMPGGDSAPRSSRLTSTQSSLHLIQYCHSIQHLLDGLVLTDPPQTLLDAASSAHALLGDFLSEAGSSCGKSSQGRSESLTPHVGSRMVGEVVARQLSYDVTNEIVSELEEDSCSRASYASPVRREASAACHSSAVRATAGRHLSCKVTPGPSSGGAVREASESEVGGGSAWGVDQEQADSNGCGGSSISVQEHAHPGSTCIASCLRLQADHEEALVCLGQVGATMDTVKSKDHPMIGVSGTSRHDMLGHVYGDLCKDSIQELSLVAAT